MFMLTIHFQKLTYSTGSLHPWLAVNLHWEGFTGPVRNQHDINHVRVKLYERE